MKPSTVLCFDCETAGLLESDPVLEVGAVLYSVQHAATIECYSALLHAEENPAVAVNGIAPALVQAATNKSGVWTRVRELADRADVIIAHNAAFDRPRCPMTIQGIRPWVCSMTEIQWPRQCSSKSLVALLLAHGLGVSHAHRALTDALMIASLLERCAELGSDVAAMLERAMLPRVKVIANVSYDDRARARDAGFSWDAPSKLWTKRMLPEEAEALGFPYRIEATP